jgi:hypothetical protein
LGAELLLGFLLQHVNTAAASLAVVIALAVGGLLCVDTAYGQVANDTVLKGSKSDAAPLPVIQEEVLLTYLRRPTFSSAPVSHWVSDLEYREPDSDAPLIGAVIGGAAGAVLSLVLSEHATGSSAVLPLFVLGGVLIGYGVGTAFE